MNTLERALRKRGLSPADAAKSGNLPHSTLYMQLKGARNLGVKTVLRYEAALGIPRSELRPDLWPPDDPKEAGCANG